jgi:hypothetical protein
MHVHEPSRDLGLSTAARGPPRHLLTKLATMVTVLDAAGLGLFTVTVPDTRRERGKRYARHIGRAGFLREQIDAATGE